jgi:hypothetical protein
MADSYIRFARIKCNLKAFSPLFSASFTAGCTAFDNGAEFRFEIITAQAVNYFAANISSFERELEVSAENFLNLLKLLRR